MTNLTKKLLMTFLLTSSAFANPFRFTQCSEVKEIETGFLCALRPSFTDSRISDINPKGKDLGYGHHVIGIPYNMSNQVDLQLHFTGSFGKPYIESDRTFPSEQYLSEAMEAGKVVIQLAYNNSDSVNLNTCNTTKGLYTDNCAGYSREEKLTGKNVSVLNETRYYDGIDFRLPKVITYLQKRKVLPADYNFSWEQTGVSGHSQGAGMVLYIAKIRRIKRGCMIAGGYDLPDLVGRNRTNLADWIQEFGYQTPKRMLKSVLHTRDDYYSNFEYLDEYLDLYSRGNVYESTKYLVHDRDGARITSYHNAAIDAVELKDLRMKACFN